MKIVLASGSPRRAELLALIGYPFRIRVAHIDEHSVQEQVLRELASLTDRAIHRELVKQLALAKGRAVLSELISEGARAIERLFSRARSPDRGPEMSEEKRSGSVTNSEGFGSVSRQAEATVNMTPEQRFFDEGDPSGYVILAADTIVCLDQDILGKPQDAYEAESMLRRLSGKTHLVHTGVSALSVTADGVLLSEHSLAETTEVSFLDLDSALERRLKDYVASGEPLDKAGAYGIQDYGAVFISAIKGDYYNVMGLPLAKVTRLLDRLSEQTPNK